MRTPPQASMRKLRQVGRRIGPLRSAYHLLLEVRAAAIDGRGRATRWFDAWYRTSQDPWGYSTRDKELERYRLAREMVESWVEAPSPDTLEVGSGEGLFTAQLAAHARAVTGLELSPVAIARAEARCRGLSNVEFRQWDARVGRIDEDYGLVVCMDVFGEIRRPIAKRHAVDVVARAVAPGGYLLVSDVVHSPVVERALWARWLGRSNRWLRDRLAERHGMKSVRTANTASHTITMFRASSSPEHRSQRYCAGYGSP